MTALTVRPLRPALSLPPSLCTSQNRPAPTKLSLLIPSSAESDSLNAPSPCRSTGTPIAGKKPKLSLSFGNDTRRTFTTSGSFSSSRLSSCSPSDDESTTSQEDITSRNTIVNTHIASAPRYAEEQCRWTRSYSYTEVSGRRSILKGSPSHSRPCVSLSRSVSFESEHTVIPSPCEEEEEYEIIPCKQHIDDIENMSPPSTTSSTDSEESESDSEPKTPIDDEDDSRGRSFDRFASAPRGGKWRRPKREWVWTLGGGDSNDIMQELEYSNANLMQIDAI